MADYFMKASALAAMFTVISACSATGDVSQESVANCERDFENTEQSAAANEDEIMDLINDLMEESPTGSEMTAEGDDLIEQIERAAQQAPAAPVPC